MNGFSLLLAFTSLGVVYSWRTGVDQQQEYVLQIEPEILQQLAAGEEIYSDAPSEAGPFQRLCIMVLPKDGSAARHTAAGEERFRQLLVSAGRYASRDRTLVTPDNHPPILWPGRSGGVPDQTYGITTGWQPGADDKQQYIAQIDPTLIGTLVTGDELYVPVDPAAGRPARFVVKVGREQLPRIGGTATSPQSPTQPGVQPGATSRSRNLSLSDGGTTNWGSYPQDNTRQPSRFGSPPADTPLDPRGTPFTLPGTLPFPPSAAAGSQWTYGSTSPATPPPTSYSNYNAPGTAVNLDPYRQSPPTGAEVTVPPGYTLQPIASQQPQLPPNARSVNNPYPENRTAAMPTTPGSTGTIPPAGSVGFSSAPTVPLQPDKPWGPLLFVTFALFFSIGGNLYLAYTALEFHSRYRSAIERLRSAARSA
jgi:hypothetical protein